MPFALSVTQLKNHEQRLAARPMKKTLQNSAATHTRIARSWHAPLHSPLHDMPMNWLAHGLGISRKIGTC